MSHRGSIAGLQFIPPIRFLFSKKAKNGIRQESSMHLVSLPTYRKGAKGSNKERKIEGRGRGESVSELDGYI